MLFSREKLKLTIGETEASYKYIISAHQKDENNWIYGLQIYTNSITLSKHVLAVPSSQRTTADRSQTASGSAVAIFS